MGCMLVKVERKGITCEELSAYLGYAVRGWSQSPDGSFEVDIDLPKLTSEQRKQLTRKMMLIPLQLDIEGYGITYDVL